MLITDRLIEDSLISSLNKSIILSQLFALHKKHKLTIQAMAAKQGISSLARKRCKVLYRTRIGGKDS